MMQWIVIIIIKAPICGIMNSAIVVAYNNNKNGDDDYVYSIGNGI